jgi:methyl-accepting chemotaxis protein
VGSAITQIDDATGQNSVLIEQSAAAAGSLPQQAQAPAGTAARFQLGQATPN